MKLERSIKSSRFWATDPCCIHGGALEWCCDSYEHHLAHISFPFRHLVGLHFQLHHVTRPGQVLSLNEFQGVIYISFKRWGTCLLRWVSINLLPSGTVPSNAQYGSRSISPESWVTMMNRAFCWPVRNQSCKQETHLCCSRPTEVSKDVYYHSITWPSLAIREDCELLLLLKPNTNGNQTWKFAEQTKPV